MNSICSIGYCLNDITLFPLIEAPLPGFYSNSGKIILQYT